MNTDRDRITDRLERDLNQIADRATPSSTAWEAVRQRIDEQDTNATSGATTMEVIMLSPDRNEPNHRSRTWMLIAASVAALALVGGLLVAANRDDTVPADRPAVTVPDTTTDTAGVDGETAPVPDAESAGEPEVSSDPTLAGNQDTLPAVDRPTQGVMTGSCSQGQFEPTDDGGAAGPQTCQITGDPQPAPARERGTLQLLPSADPESEIGSFASVGDDGSYTIGYAYDGGDAIRYVGVSTGIDDYTGETIHLLGHTGPSGGDAVTDWTIEPGDAPLPTTEEGGISAEVTITCSATFVSGGDTEQVLDQSCTYTSDDPRFDRAPEVIRVRIFAADPDATTLAEYPLFVTGGSDGGYVVDGIAEDTTTLRGLGVRPGSGEFEGLLIHDVLHLVTDQGGNLTGTIRSTVYPAD